MASRPLSERARAVRACVRAVAARRSPPFLSRGSRLLAGPPQSPWYHYLSPAGVVPYLLGEPEELAVRASEIIEREEALTLGALALVESAYVLQSVYGVPRPRVVDALMLFVQRHNIRLPDLPKSAALEAMELCRPSGRHSFTDAFLWARARHAGASAIATFDRRFPAEDVRLTDSPA